VGLVKHTPLFRREANRVFETLEYDITIFAALAVCTKCGKGCCMRSVISKVEAAYQRQLRNPGILQAFDSRTQQACAFVGIGCFSFELSDFRQVR